MSRIKVIVYGLICLLGLSSEAGAAEFRIKNKKTEESNILFSNFEYRLKTPEVIEGTADAEAAKLTDAQLKAMQDLGKQILEVVVNDLKSTNLFKILNQDPKELKKITANPELLNLVLNQVPNFDMYNEYNIESVLSGEIALIGTDQIRLSVKLWDIMDENRLFGKYYDITPYNWRRAAHLIANEIYTGLTGENSGHFDSKLTFIVETGSVKKRVQKIAEIDYDGQNFHYLTDGSKLVATPIYSNDKQSIFYLEYTNKFTEPLIRRLDLQSKTSKQLGSFIGMAYSPARHPTKNNIIALAIANGSASNLYEIDLNSMQIRQLTKSNAIDTTPFYSPDGKQLVFSSDRTGAQKLYILDLETLKVKLLSKGSGNYAKPAWSPDGLLIAFTKSNRGKFSIGLMTVDGKNEREIASGYMVEGVKWSPNGRYIVYSKQQGVFGKESIPVLLVNDVLTGHEYKIPVPERLAAVAPDWVSKN